MLDRLRQKPTATPPPQAAPKQPAAKDMPASTLPAGGQGHEFGQMQVSPNAITIDEMASQVRVGEATSLPPGARDVVKQAVEEAAVAARSQGPQKASAGGSAPAGFEKEFVARYKGIRARLPKGPETLPEDPLGELPAEEQGEKGPASGHTQARYVKGWGRGFNALQNYLNQSTAWSDVHEEAQNLIRDYALWKTGQSPRGTAESVKEFSRYIGKGEASAKAVDLYNYRQRQAKLPEVPRSSEMGGYAGAQDWCAAASSTAFLNVLRARGLTVGDFDRWLDKGKGRSLQVVGKEAYNAPLYPGDVVTIITQATPLSGHVATVADFDPASNTLLIVSGNAGGGGGQGIGTVRFDQVMRETPPSGYDYGEVAGLGKKLVSLGKERERIKLGKSAQVMDWVEDPETQTSRGVVNPEKQKTALMEVGTRIRSLEQNPLLQTQKVGKEKEPYSPKPTRPGVAWVTKIYWLSKFMTPGALDQMSPEELARFGIVRRQQSVKSK